MIFRFHRRYRLLRRYKDIVNVLLAHGLGILVDRFRLLRFVSFTRRFFPRPVALDEREQSLAGRLRRALEELGPTFIKFGQLLSLRPDIIPAEYAQALRGLQDRIAPDDFAYVRHQVEESLAGKLEDIFARFEERPVGSASISQAHRARLKTGEEVIVKVLHRDIHRTVNEDMEVLYGFARFLEHHVPESRSVSPVRLVEQFEKTILRELDLSHEAENCEEFRRNFQDDERVVFPRVHWNLTRRQILTIEFIAGLHVLDRETMLADGIDPLAVARTGADIFARMVLRDGVFHGDPHPGNLFILRGGRIGFIDFGITGRLTAEMQEQVIRLLAGVVYRDARVISRVLYRLDALPTHFNEQTFRSEMEEFFQQFASQPLGRLEVGRLVFEVMRLATKHRVRLPADFSLLSKALLTMESIGRQLDPDFLLIPFLKPYIYEFLTTRVLAPASVAQAVLHFLDDSRVLFQDLPYRLDGLLRMLERGEMRIEFDHRGLEPLVESVDRVGLRLAGGLFAAALVLGGSIVAAAGAEPMVLGMPLLGLVQFLAALGLTGLLFLGATR